MCGFWVRVSKKKTKKKDFAHAQCVVIRFISEDGCAHRPGAEEGNSVLMCKPISPVCLVLSGFRETPGR